MSQRWGKHPEMYRVENTAKEVARGFLFSEDIADVIDLFIFLKKRKILHVQ